MAPRPAPSLFFPLTATAHRMVAYSRSFILCPLFSVLALIPMPSGSPVPLRRRSLLRCSAVPSPPAVPCSRSSIRLSDVCPSRSVSSYLPSSPSLPSPSSLCSAFLVLVLIFCLVPVSVCPLAACRPPTARRPMSALHAPSARCAPSSVRLPRAVRPLRAVPCLLSARRLPAARRPLSACRAVRSVADRLPASGSPARPCHYIRSAPGSAAFARPAFGPLSCSAQRSASQRLASSVRHSSHRRLLVLSSIPHIDVACPCHSTCHVDICSLLSGTRRQVGICSSLSGTRLSDVCSPLSRTHDIDDCSFLVLFFSGIHPVDICSSPAFVHLTSGSLRSPCCVRSSSIR
jgi:hypothetical protein